MMVRSLPVACLRMRPSRIFLSCSRHGFFFPWRAHSNFYFKTFFRDDRIRKSFFMTGANVFFPWRPQCSGISNPGVCSNAFLVMMVRSLPVACLRMRSSRFLFLQPSQNFFPVTAAFECLLQNIFPWHSKNFFHDGCKWFFSVTAAVLWNIQSRSVQQRFLGNDGETSACCMS